MRKKSYYKTSKFAYLFIIFGLIESGCSQKKRKKGLVFEKEGAS